MADDTISFEEWLKIVNQKDSSILGGYTVDEILNPESAEASRQDGAREKRKALEADYEKSRQNDGNGQEQNNQNSNDGNTQNDGSSTEGHEASASGENLSVGEGHTDPAPENNKSWRQEKQDSWKQWSQDNGYTYAEDAEVTDALKFDISKGEEKSTIQYNSKNDVTLESAEGSTPDFKVFDHLAKEAKKDGIPGITFKDPEQMTEEFKQKLAIACIKHGLNMDGGPLEIDRSLVPPEDTMLLAKVDTYNKKNQLEAIYKRESAAAQQTADAGTEFDIAAHLAGKSSEEAAVTFAAYQNKGVKFPADFETNLNKDNALGLFTAKPNLLPKEAEASVKKFNQERADAKFNELKTNATDITATRRLGVAAKFETILNKDEHKDHKGDPYYKAVLFSVYAEQGVKFGDLKKVNNTPDGRFSVPTMTYLPEHVHETVQSQNKSSVSRHLNNLRRNISTEMPTLTGDDKSNAEQFEKFEAAKDVIRLMVDKGVDKDTRLALNQASRTDNGVAGLSDPNVDNNLNTFLSGLTQDKDIQKLFGDKDKADAFKNASTPEEKLTMFKDRYQEAATTMREQGQKDAQSDTRLFSVIRDRFNGRP